MKRVVPWTMKLVWFAVTLLGSSAASAEPDAPTERALVGGGVVLGADHAGHGALVVDGAVKLPSARLWVHGQGALGHAFMIEGGGDFWRALVGLETRGCTSLALCGYLGLDTGLAYKTLNIRHEMTRHDQGLLIGPRFGLDVGREQMRFRLGLEVYAYRYHSEVTMARWVAGVGLQTTLSFRL